MKLQAGSPLSMPVWRRRAQPSISAAGSVVIVSVSSDEPDDANADGSTINDIVIGADCKSLKVRAERKGDGNGRVYVVTFKVTDASGNVSTATAKITVPNSQNGTQAVDDKPSFTISSGCS